MGGRPRSCGFYVRRATRSKNNSESESTPFLCVSRVQSRTETKRPHRSKLLSPVAPPGAAMAIDFQSELIRFGKEVRRLAENPFQRQLEEARREWNRRKLQSEGAHD